MSTKPLRANCPDCLFSGSPCGIHRDTPPQPAGAKHESGEPPQPTNAHPEAEPGSVAPRAEEPAASVDAAFPAELAPGETEEPTPASVELLVAKTFQLADDLERRRVI